MNDSRIWEQKERKSNNIEICGGCMIGAGAVVVRDIGVKGTYVGVPARRKGSSNILGP